MIRGVRPKAAAPAPAKTQSKPDPTFVPKAQPTAGHSAWASVAKPVPVSLKVEAHVEGAAGVAAARAAPWAGVAVAGSRSKTAILKPVSDPVPRPPCVALPIDKHMPVILKAVCHNPVVVVEAATGSGKSSRVPRHLADDLSVAGLVVVTQPRRIAATSLAKRVAAEIGVELGGVVGYAIGQERNYGDKTRLLFCTVGWLLSKLTADPGFESQIGVLVMDEVHERSIAADMVSVLAKLMLTQSVAPPRLVLMSATMNGRLVEYFTLPGSPEPPMITVNVPTYPVTEEYLTGDLALDIARSYPGFPSEYVKRVSAAVADRIRASSDAATLVFVDGLNMIHEIQDALKKDPVDVFVLHSHVPAEDQDAVFKAHGPGDRRRVIIATNIAETSVTIPDVTLVIDLGTVKEVHYDGGRSILVTTWVSKDTARQRRGRTGRTCPGVVLRMYPRDAFEKLPLSSTPEILRVSLEDTVLNVMESMTGKGRFKSIYEVMSALPDPVSEHRVAEALRALVRAGALATRDGEELDHYDMPDQADLRVTPLGELLRKLPMGIEFGTMVAMGLVLSSPEAVVYAVLMSAVSSSQLPIYALPNPTARESELDSFVRSSVRLAHVRATNDRGDLSESLAEARLLLRYMANGGQFEWCTRNSVHGHRARAAANTVAETAMRLVGALPKEYRPSLYKLTELARHRGKEALPLPDESPEVPAMCAFMIMHAFGNNKLHTSISISTRDRNVNKTIMSGPGFDAQAFKRGPLMPLGEYVASVDGPKVTFRYPSELEGRNGHDLVMPPPAIGTLMQMCTKRGGLDHLVSRFEPLFMTVGWSDSRGEVFVDRSSALARLTERCLTAEERKAIERRDQRNGDDDSDSGSDDEPVSLYRRSMAYATSVREVLSRDGRKRTTMVGGLTVIPPAVLRSLESPGVKALLQARLEQNYISDFEGGHGFRKSFIAAAGRRA